MSPIGNFIQRDSVGGASIRGFAGSVLELDAPDLFAIDFEDAPHLEVIRLTRLDPVRPPHLGFSDLPALRHVVLPAKHQPAIIHLAASALPVSLFVDGRVDMIDAAWGSSQFSLQSHPERGPWCSVLLTTEEKRANEVLEPGLVVLDGTRSNATALSLQDGPDWLLVGFDDLQRVEISARGSVTLQGLPQLTDVHSDADALTLNLDSVPALVEVSGTGHKLTLRQPRRSAGRLVIGSGWKHARLHDPTLRTLSFTGGETLCLFDCGALREVTVPQTGISVECNGTLPAPLVGRATYFFDEASLNASIARLADGDDSPLDGVLNILARAHQSGQVVVSLQRLARLCELGVEPQRIWDTRRTLSANHLRHARGKAGARSTPDDTAKRRADARWDWSFPRDLAPQGWEADLRVWCYCEGDVPATAAYRQTMTRGCQDVVARETLLRLAGNADATPALFALGVGMLSHLLDNASGRGDEAIAGTSLGRLARMLSGAHADAMSRQVVVAFICETQPIPALIDALSGLMPLAPSHFRVALMTIARRPAAWFEARLGRNPPLRQRWARVESLRQRLLQHALSPLPVEADSPRPVHKL